MVCWTNWLVTDVEVTTHLLVAIMPQMINIGGKDCQGIVFCNNDEGWLVLRGRYVFHLESLSKRNQSTNNLKRLEDCDSSQPVHDQWIQQH